MEMSTAWRLKGPFKAATCEFMSTAWRLKGPFKAATCEFKHEWKCQLRGV